MVAKLGLKCELQKTNYSLEWDFISTAAAAADILFQFDFHSFPLSLSHFVYISSMLSHSNALVTLLIIIIIVVRRRQFYGFHQPLLNAIKVDLEDIQPTKRETTNK